MYLSFTESLLGSQPQITDPEPLIAVLKACLRIANQHLTTATLSAIPPLLPLIIHRPNGTPNASARPFSSSSSTSSIGGSTYDVFVLRNVMSSFLPSPGVIERLGDTREKARERARETLAIIGGFAFRCSPPTSKLGSGKGAEPPIVYFERFLRDSGLSSKVWRVREQVRVPFLCSQQLANGFLLVNLGTGEYPSDSSYLPHQTIPLTFGGRAGRHRWECSRVRDPFDHRAFHGSRCHRRRPFRPKEGNGEEGRQEGNP